MPTGTSSTSFRISTGAKQALADRAAREHTSATALLERLIVEGIRQLDHPGITFRGPEHDRRAALAAGPDIWEIVSRLGELDGPEEHRIAALADEIDLHPRLIRIAVDYAAAHHDEILERIENNRQAAHAAREAAANRQALLA
jgi:hypothetical protein